MAEPETDDLTNEEYAEGVRLTEQEIQEAAWTDEPKAEEPGAEQPDGAEDQEQVAAEAPKAEGDRPRNEKGQFTKAEEAAKPPEQPEEGKQEQPDGEEQMPRWRMREIAEERRQAVAERDQLRAELARMQTQMARPQAQEQPQPQQPIDPLLDPQGWQRQIEARFEEQRRTDALDFDLRLAHRDHKEVFEKAYEALLQHSQRDNGVLVRQLTANPRGAGDRIVNWYRTNELLRETKGDLQGYEKGLREKLLKDPEFLKAAMEAARGQANGGQQVSAQQGNRPNNITRLPPSLSRQAGGSPNSDPIDTDDSEKAVFDYAFNG